MTNLDYSLLWSERFHAAKGAQEMNPYDKPERAAQYDASQPIRTDGLARAAAFSVCSEDTVLDIGSGPGILALPLAARVKQVTAVEPSAAMRALLEQHAAEQQLHNLQILPCRWEDAVVVPHDIVIASYSLRFPNLRLALERMQAAARRRVYLYWFSGRASWEQLQADLLERVTGRVFYEQPKSDLLYGMLVQMGFSPLVKPLVGTRFCYDYPTLAAAVENLRERLNTNDRTHDLLLADYIRAHYCPLPNNGWRFWDKTHYVELSWSPTERREVDT